MARAIWKGRLTLGDEQLPVKLYSAVEDRTVHFRLLHAKDKAPVEQRIVRKSDGKEVPKEQWRKAFAVDDQRMVMIQPDELEELQPRDSCDIVLRRFVRASLISDQWYDRPYYAGPDDDDAAYFALATAIEREGKVGVARWVMRKKRYVGALAAIDGYLMLVTLRRAEQISSVENVEPPASRRPEPKELKLAQQFVQSMAGDFEPEVWRNDYHDRVCQLIEAKASGEKIELKPPKVKRGGGNLADQLQRSLAQAKERNGG